MFSPLPVNGNREIERHSHPLTEREIETDRPREKAKDKCTGCSSVRFAFIYQIWHRHFHNVIAHMFYHCLIVSLSHSGCFASTPLAPIALHLNILSSGFDFRFYLQILSSDTLNNTSWCFECCCCYWVVVGVVVGILFIRTHSFGWQIHFLHVSHMPVLKQIPQYPYKRCVFRSHTPLLSLLTML